VIPAVTLLICTTPTPTPPTDPTLVCLLAEAHSQSLDLTLATARLEAARVAARASGAELRPQLDGAAQTERRRNAKEGELLPSTATSHRAVLEASWEIDLWGRLRHVRVAATRELEAAEADLRGARLLLEADVVRAYQDLRYAQAALKIQDLRLNGFRRVLSIHQARHGAGLATNAETFRAESDLRQTATEAQVTRREVIQARHRLALLLGRKEGTLADLLPAPPSALPDLPPGLSSEILSARPDLQAASRRHEAALARVGEAQAARLPRLTLTGAYGLASAELKNLARSESVAWNLAPRLSVALFDGGRARSRVQAARVEAEQAGVERRQIYQRALVEVAENLALLEVDTLAQVQWDASALAAERVSLGRTAEQQAGRGTGLVTAQTELQVLALRLQSLLAARTRDHTRVALRLAMGLSWIQ